METHPSPQPTSPNSTSSTSSSSSSSCCNNNNNINSNATTPLATSAPATPISTASHVITPKLPTINPKAVDSNPYPTTFIQADTSSFKQVVQLLTGSAATAAKHAVPPPPPKNAVLPPKRPAFKLYERRNGSRSLKTISPLAPASRNSTSGFSPRRRQQLQQQPEILSPSVLDFPALMLSPVTPLNPDPFNRSPQPNPAAAAAAAADEERAIAERGFYLHPSPRSVEPPRLLPLFPVTSPRACPSPAAATTTAGSFP